MNWKRAQISQCFIRREELVQMKIEFTLLFAVTFDLHTFVNLMLSNCVIQLLQFVF